MGCGDDVFAVAKALGVKYGNTAMVSKIDYRGTKTCSNVGGYKKFSDARGAGEKQIGNFTGK